MLLIINIYFLLSLGIIISSSFVVFSNNTIYSLLWLVLSFLFTSSFLLVLGCEFLALIFIVIYVGAIAVLFLFVVMLLDLKIKNLKSKQNNSFTSVGFLSFVLLLCLFFLSSMNENCFTALLNFKFYFLFAVDKISLIFINWKDFLNSTNEIEIYSVVLYDIFIIQLLLIGFILLAVLIGIIRLTGNYQSKQLLDQSNFKQISVSSRFFHKIK